MSYACFNFPCLNLIEIVILWVNYTIPFSFSLFWHFLVISFQLFILPVWQMITDEGSVPEMRIWSMSLIQSDLKWCVHLRRSLYLNLSKTGIGSDYSIVVYYCL